MAVPQAGAPQQLEGFLWKQGEKGLVKGWKKRFCHLEQGTKVYYAKDKGDKDIGFIDLKLVSMVTPCNTAKSSSAFGFELRTPNRTWSLSAETDADRTMWISGLQTAINKAAEQKALAFVNSSQEGGKYGPNRNTTGLERSNLIMSSAENSIRATEITTTTPGEDKGWERRRGFSKSRSTGQLPTMKMNSQASSRAAEAPELGAATPAATQLVELGSPATQPASTGSPTSAAPVGSDRPKDFVKRSQTAKEILSTERSYLESLKIMIEYYLNPMLMAVKNTKVDPVNFTDADIKSLFSLHLNLILGVNLELCKSLEQRLNEWSDTQKVGDVFLTMAPFLKMYYEYSVNYDSAIDTYNKLMKEPNFQQRLLSYRTASGKNLGLEHLLIMPVQRLPRYALLLSELLKETPNDHPDFDNLKKAIKSLTDVVQHINDGMKRADASRKVATDYELFVQPHRLLVWDGNFEVKQNKQKIDMKLILFNDILVHLPRSNARNKTILTAPESQCPLQLVWIGLVEGGNFELTTPLKTYFIGQTTPEEKEFIAKLTTSVDKVLGGTGQSQERRSKHQFTAEITYDGQWNHGQMQGAGVFVFANVSTYEGNFANSQKSGKGKMTWHNGAIYEGEWQNDLPHGRGVIIYKSGDKFMGEFREGMKSGLGEMHYANGDKYRGEWLNDKQHGNGYLYTTTGNYEGGFCYGLFHGGGKYMDAHGRVYEGGWLNGLQEGDGAMDFGGGNVFKGKWANGKRHGKGTMQFSSPNGKTQTYVGDWANDKKEGAGLIQYADGSTYDGTWKDDRRHGTGKYIFTRSDHAGRATYEGEWSTDRMHGKGTLIFLNGDRYEGQFVNNLYHGSGVLTHGDRKLEGKFTSGALEGKMTYSDKAQMSFTGGFKSNAIAQPSGLPFDCLLPPPIADIILPQM